MHGDWIAQYFVERFVLVNSDPSERWRNGEILDFRVVCNDMELRQIIGVWN